MGGHREWRVVSGGHGEKSVGGHRDIQLSRWKQCEVDKVAQDLFTSCNFSL